MTKPKIFQPIAAFGDNPKINSDADLNRALGEIGYLEAVEAERQAELKAEIARISEEAQAKCVVAMPRGKKQLPISEYLQTLRETAAEYCESKRGQLLEGDKKSREFTHGVIGWKDEKAKIDFCDGYSTSKVEKLLDTLAPGGILKKIRKLLDSIFFVGTRPVALVAEPKLSLSKTNVKKAYEADKLKDDHLEAIGLKYVEATEKFYLKPNQVSLRSEAA